MGQRHGTQPKVVEKSARGLLRTQNRVAGTTEVMAGSLLRDPGCSGPCPEGLGVPSTYRDPVVKGSENQISALILYCCPGPRESSSARAEWWAARGAAALLATMG